MFQACLSVEIFGTYKSHSRMTNSLEVSRARTCPSNGCKVVTERRGLLVCLMQHFGVGLLCQLLIHS